MWFLVFSNWLCLFSYLLLDNFFMKLWCKTIYRQDKTRNALLSLSNYSPKEKRTFHGQIDPEIFVKDPSLIFLLLREWFDEISSFKLFTQNPKFVFWRQSHESTLPKYEVFWRHQIHSGCIRNSVIDVGAIQVQTELVSNGWNIISNPFLLKRRFPLLTLSNFAQNCYSQGLPLEFFGIKPKNFENGQNLQSDINFCT